MQIKIMDIQKVYKQNPIIVNQNEILSKKRK